MNYESIKDKIKQTKIENFIWVIYLGIIFLSWYSNTLERKYLIYNDLKSKREYRKIIIFIFSILIIIYFYFFKNSYDDYINRNDNLETKKLLSLSVIASLLILISGIIFLYISIQDENLNVELAFN